LASMVCAGSLEAVEAVAKLHPNIIIAEAPELIGAGSAPAGSRPEIAAVNRRVWEVDPDIRILHAAGISTGADVYDIVAAGSQGSGSSSGVCLADDPRVMLREMIQAVRQAWDDTHDLGRKVESP
jgi:triosephosphate isomerase